MALYDSDWDSLLKLIRGVKWLSVADGFEADLRLVLRRNKENEAELCLVFPGGHNYKGPSVEILYEDVSQTQK
ncbi:MAG TPA: hypothetical protein VEW05_28145 [Candidatus Polarisedimenticolia bacterium]|nr:hypothetical protein [Candidatus Polarisedimenticolia bacterium]